MKQTIRSLFVIADILVGIWLLLALWILAGSFFDAIDATLGAQGELSMAVAGRAWLHFGLLAVAAAVCVFGCILHFRRNVIGPMILAVLGFVAIFVPARHTDIYAVAYVIQATVFGLPWILTWLDLRKRGLLKQPSGTPGGD